MVKGRSFSTGAIPLVIALSSVLLLLSTSTSTSSGRSSNCIATAARDEASLMQNKYTIVFSTDAFNPLETPDLLPEQLYPMRLSNGSAYVCVLPREDAVSAPLEKAADIVRNRLKTEDTHASNTAAPQKQKQKQQQQQRGSGGNNNGNNNNNNGNNNDARRAFRRGKRVSKALINRINNELQSQCYLRMAGWWSYELCWNTHVRQVHLGAQPQQTMQDPSNPSQHQQQATPIEPNKLPIEVEYFLGKGAAYNEPRGASGAYFFDEHPTNGRYIGTTFYNGTQCDINSAQRECEVRLFCAEDSGKDDLFLDVSERETCKYVVSMWSNRACIPELMTGSRKIQVSCYQLNH